MTALTTVTAGGTAATAVPPWTLALGAMLSVQLGSALSVPLIEQVGAAGTAWLRLTSGALVFLAVARPPLRSVRRTDVLPLLGLGVASGLLTICFLAAIERIPLGTAVAVEFLGPLTVAALRSHSARALAWPALALPQCSASRRQPGSSARRSWPPPRAWRCCSPCCSTRSSCSRCAA